MAYKVDGVAYKGDSASVDAIGNLTLYDGLTPTALFAADRWASAVLVPDVIVPSAGSIDKLAPDPSDEPSFKVGDRVQVEAPPDGCEEWQDAIGTVAEIDTDPTWDAPYLVNFEPPLSFLYFKASELIAAPATLTACS